MIPNALKKKPSLLSETRCSPKTETPTGQQAPQSKLPFDTFVSGEDANGFLDHRLAEELAGANPTYKVFTAINEIALGKDIDTKDRLTKLTQKLRSLTCYRPLRLPGIDVEDRIAHLMAEFPNFSRVTRSIVGVHARLLERGISHRMPPILLLGPPGVGKTVYAEAAGELLSAPVLRVDFASENSPAGLAGSSNFWSNSSPGRLFNLLAFGEGSDPVANPVIFVDEMDKAPKNAQYDITGPLLRLLEKTSAQTFVDQSASHIVLDTSQVRWILTANQLDGVSEPLRSRLVIFNIKPPTEQQAMGIAQSIASKTVQEFGVERFHSKLPESILADCASMTPREVRLRIEIAIALAITEDVDCITPAIWKNSAIDEEPLQERRRSIGFI